MDSLMRQTGLRYSRARQEKTEDSRSISDQRTALQKTPTPKRVSFTEKKKSQNWLQRQFSRQDHGLSSEEHAAAVAASAVAIQSLEELDTRERGQTDVPLTKVKSRRADTTRMPSETGKRSSRFSGEPSKTDMEVPGKGAPTSDQKWPEKAISSAPSMKRTPTSLANSQSGSTSMKKPPTLSDSQLGSSSKKAETALPKPDLPPFRPSSEMARQIPSKPGQREAQADAWEKAEMAKIKEKYDKLNATIHEWEEKKMTKAKRRQSRAEDEIAHKRTKATKHYREEMARIEQIAGGARAQAEQNRRKEEVKAKEKANRIIETGKMPATCLCF